MEAQWLVSFVGGRGDISRACRCSVLVGGIGNYGLRLSNDGGGGYVSIRDICLLLRRGSLGVDGGLFVNGRLGCHNDGSRSRAIVVALFQNITQNRAQHCNEWSAILVIQGQKVPPKVRRSPAEGLWRKFKSRCVPASPIKQPNTVASKNQCVRISIIKPLALKRAMTSANVPIIQILEQPPPTQV